MSEPESRNTRARTWRWPISPDTVRSVLSSHSVLGLAFAAIIYLVCLTGTIAVFAPDLERWEVPAAPVETRLSDGAAARALVDGAALAPPGTVLYLTLPSAARDGATLLAHSASHERKWAVDRVGRLIPFDARWTEFLVDLHVTLHLPRSWGAFIVGLTGVALLSSLVSGILAHPRVLRDAFHLRLGGSRRLQEADIHNRLGVWALPFHFTLALTGSLLGLSTIIVAVLSLLLYRGDMGKVYELFLDPPPPVDARTVPLPDMVALIAQARERAPGAAPQTIMIERPGRADTRVSIHSGRVGLLVQQDETQFDADGKVVNDEHPDDLVLGTRVLGGIGQLHFGWFGGLPVRLAYGMLGLALCVVTSSGVTIWLARRRDRGRAAPPWERLWAGVCWGQPVVLVLSALVAIAWHDVALSLAWLVLTTGSLAVAASVKTITGIRLAHIARVILGSALPVLALVHAISVFGSGSCTAWVVDMLMLASGLVLLVFHRRRG